MEAEPLFGIPELDGTLTPYLPPGCLVLLRGDRGSGSYLLAKQFAQAGAGFTPVLFYTTSEQTVDAAEAFRSFGWDPEAIRFSNLADEYYQQVLAPQLEVSRTREQGLTLAEVRSATRGEVAPAPYNLIARFLNDLAALDGRFRLVLDSLDFLLEVLSLSEVMNVVRQIRYRAQLLGGRALVSVLAAAPDGRTAGMLEDAADLVIALTSEPNGEVYDHSVEIRKVRNHPERTAIRRVIIGDHGYQLAP